MKTKFLIFIFSINTYLTLGLSSILPHESFNRNIISSQNYLSFLNDVDLIPKKVLEGYHSFKIENLNASIFNKTEIKIEYHWKIVGRINSSYGVVDRFVGDYFSTSPTKPTEDQQITTLLNRYNSHPDYYGSNVRVEKIYSCEFIRKIEY